MNSTSITWEQAVLWLRDQPDRQKIVYDCYYDDPAEMVAERYFKSEEWQAVKQILKPKLPGNVLDLGAGRGISSYAFAKMGCRVTAIEPDPSDIVGMGCIKKLAKNTGLEIAIQQQYGEQIHSPDSSFDIVYGRAVLHHARNLKAVCCELKRVLKPGGLFFFTREHVISKPQDLEQFFRTHPLHALYGGENAFLLEDYLAAISSAGLKIIDVLGPFESAINYAPLNREEMLQAMVPMSVPKRFRKSIRLLIGIPPIERLLGQYLSKKSDTPGRLFSFLAIKNDHK